MDNNEINETLSVEQRRKRGQVMRAHHTKIERAREIAQRKLAAEKNLRKRAFQMARSIMRKKLAGQHGAEYAQLGPSEKVAIDRMLDGKGKAIKKLALRLMPKVKKAEYERLQSYLHGHTMQNMGAEEGHTMKEDVNDLFEAAFSFPQDPNRPNLAGSPNSTMNSGLGSKPRVAKDGGKSKNDNIEFYKPFDNGKPKKIAEALDRKADQSGIDFDVLAEVFTRGLEAWDENLNVTQEQYAFARVNSFINQGKTYFNEDADLHELTQDTLRSYHKNRLNSDKYMDSNKYDKHALRALGKIHDDDAFDPDLGRAKGAIVKVPASKKRKYDVAMGTFGDYKEDADLHEATKFRKARDPWSPDVVLPNEAYHPVTGKLNKNSQAWRDHVKSYYPKHLWAQHGVKEDVELDEDWRDTYYKASLKRDSKLNRLADKDRAKAAAARKTVDEGLAVRKERMKTRSALENAWKKHVENMNKASIKKEEVELQEATEKHFYVTYNDDSGKKLLHKKTKPFTSMADAKNHIDSIAPGHPKRASLGRIHTVDKATGRILRVTNYDTHRTGYPYSPSLGDPKNIKDLHEDTELQELGPATLDSYAKKSNKEARGLVKQIGDINNKKYAGRSNYQPLNKLSSDDESQKSKLLGKLKNRKVGQARAVAKVDRMNTEEVEVQEQKKGLWANIHAKRERIKRGSGERMKSAGEKGRPTKADLKSAQTEQVEPGIEHKNTKARKRIEKVDRAAPHTELGKQGEIITKIIEQVGNKVNDPKKRLQGTDSLVKAYKGDTPGQDINESFNIAFAAGVGVTLTAADLGMRAQGGFAYHPSVIDQIEENAVTADRQPVIIPAHRDAYGNQIPAKTVLRKTSRKILDTGNTHDGEPN